MTITTAFVLSSFAVAHGYAFTTISPGGTYAPVTVTSQYQPVPTYISSAANYGTYLYVSTIVADADNKNATVTNTNQLVTIHHTKYTITHTRPEPYTASAGVPHPTGSGHFPYTKNTSTVSQSPTWTELYEKVDEAPYRDLGPSALPAYTGSGLCTKKFHGSGGIIYQPAHVSEFKNGQWSEYNTTYKYGVPMPSVTTYKQPGTYTIPEYDMTIRQTTAVAAEATYTAQAGKTVTYGGSLTEVHEPCTITASYGAYSTMTEAGQKTTKTIIKTTTISAKKPGTYTISTPTTTWYASEEVCTYPTITVYRPGVYQHPRETVKITKTGQAYTCRYHQSSMYPTGSSSEKDMYTTAPAPTSTSSTMNNGMYSSLPSFTQTPSPTFHTSGNSYHTLSSSSSFSHYPNSTSSATWSTNPYSSSSPSLSSHSASTTPCPTSSSKTPDTTPSPTTPYNPDPSSDPEDPVESYGTPSAGYVKRGGVLERRKVAVAKKRGVVKRVVLV